MTKQIPQMRLQQNEKERKKVQKQRYSDRIMIKSYLALYAQ